MSNAQYLASLVNSSGNIVIPVANAGIVFNNTNTTASPTSTTQNDYETGTFTPTQGGGLTGSSVVLTGKYTKIGNVVNIQILVTGTSLATSAGNLLIGNMPFVVSSTAGGISLGSYANQGNGNWRGFGFYSSSMYSFSSATSGDTSLYFSGTYFATF